MSLTPAITCDYRLEYANLCPFQPIENGLDFGDLVAFNQIQLYYFDLNCKRLKLKIQQQMQSIYFYSFAFVGRSAQHGHGLSFGIQLKEELLMRDIHFRLMMA